MFSILVANYNNGKYFKDCYSSIVSQTYTDWEVVIVDDCSTDNSVALINEFIGGDDRFRLYINDSNKGCGYTKHQCVLNARGSVCGFLDPDDTLMPDAIELMIKAHEQSNAVLVHSSFYYCDAVLNIGGEFKKAGFVKTDENFNNLDGRVTAFASFKRQAYMLTTGIDPTLRRAVDQDLYLKLSETGSFDFLNKPLYKYRLHDNGISSASGFKAFYYHLKAIMEAEKRRAVNLEQYVSECITEKLKRNYNENNLGNPRYLAGKMLGLLKQQPVLFFKKLFFRKYTSRITHQE